MSEPRKELLNPPHLNDAEIVAYLDGELVRSEVNASRAHLDSCWSCRSRLNEVQRRVDCFLDARADLLPPDSVLAESRVEQFRERLARHARASEEAPVAFHEQFAEWWIRLRNSAAGVMQYRRAVLASTVAVCLLVVMFTDVLNTRVSADTVLQRAATYDVSHVPVTGQVTRTSVRVDRVDLRTNVQKPLGTITLVRDSATPAIYVSANSSSGKSENATVKDTDQASQQLLPVMFSGDNSDPALVQYLATQRWVPDLSVSEFRRLVGSRGNTETSARRQDGSFELRYPFAAGHPSGISETLLRVDARDYAPTGVSIFTMDENGGSEYRFTRTSFAFEARTSEVAMLFSPGLPSEMISSRPGHEPELSRAIPLSYANSHATEAEVSLAEALHKLDSCLGEEINLFPMSDGSMLVQGLVDNATRRDAIRRALRGMSGPLRVEVYIPSELRNGSELYKPPDQSWPASPAAGSRTSATLADLSGTSVPLHELLYDHFLKTTSSTQDTDKQVALFSNEIVSLARQTFLHAWALRRLDREFSADRTSGLSAAALERIEQMRQDHRRWISAITRRQSEMLAPIAGPDATANISAAAIGQDSDALLRLAQEQNDLVRSLFTTSQQLAEPVTSLARLVTVLKQMGT